MYQRNWLGIEFKDFSKLSKKIIASPKFYNEFYTRLFQKYQDYESLPIEWRLGKRAIADWLLVRINIDDRILSVGCGIGYIEQCIWKDSEGRLRLHVWELAANSLRWLKNVLPSNNVHECNDLSSLGKFDVIYLSAVDYALDDSALVSLISSAMGSLNFGGRIIIISASFVDDSRISAVIYRLKHIFRLLMSNVGFYQFELGQFWGYSRAKSDYIKIMQCAELSKLKDGFIKNGYQNYYWIEATLD
jgi:hypothetical protein